MTAVLALARILPWWVYVFIGLIAWGYTGHHEARVAKAKIVTMQKEFDAQVKAAKAEQKLVVDALNAENAAFKKRVADATTAFNFEKADNAKKAATVAVVTAANGKLRKQLADYAAGAASQASDTVTACRERAAALGDVLGFMVQGYSRCTGEAENNASNERVLLNGWPQSE